MYTTEFEWNFAIKKKYRVKFGKQFDEQCPFMVDECNKGMMPNPIDQCPYLNCNSGKNYNIDYKDEATVSQHLLQYNHFRSFGIKQTHCIYKEKCKYYQAALKIQIVQQWSTKCICIPIFIQQAVKI